MLKKYLKKTLAAVPLLTLAVAAQAALERAGPATSLGNFPAWYQDKTGLTLDFGTPLTQAELSGGWLLMLPADVPSGVAPEAAFGNYSGEHFYWSAGAGSKAQGGMSLTMALEAAFGTGNPVAGEQIVFGRIRVKVASVATAGNWKIYTPYGIFDFPNQAVGDKIFHTVDVGLAPLNFNAALSSAIGPFLTPSAYPGGPELPAFGPSRLPTGVDPFYDSLVAAGGATALPGTNRKYLADPARLGPLTGGSCTLTVPATLTPGACVMSNDPIVGALKVPSDPATGARVRPVYVVSGAAGPELRDPNIFRAEVDGVEVPPSTGTERDFSVTGRIVEAAIPGLITVNRASYSANPDATPANKLDVYATAFPSIAPRVPPAAAGATSNPELGFFAAPCGGTAAAPTAPTVAAAYIPMNRATPGSTIWWGQATPAAIPSAVCVKDTGRAVPVHLPVQVSDEVDITSATVTPGVTFNGNSFTLSVNARTSDCSSKPALQASTQGLVLGTLSPQGDCSSGVGSFTLGNLLAPPAKVTVTSLRGGQAVADVRTAVGVPAPVGVADPNPDTATVNEDCSAAAAASCATPAVINVLENDMLAGSPLNPVTTPVTVTITTPPAHGTASIDLAGNVLYRPAAHFSGADFLGYRVTLNGSVPPAVSAESFLSVTVNPVNDAPLAVNDTLGAPAGANVALNLIANDTDPDGDADVRGVIVRTLPSAGGTLSCNGTAITALNTACTGALVFRSAAARTTSTFSYAAVDAAGLASANNATVTINVAAGETLALSRALYTSRSARWQIDGTSSVFSGQTVSLSYDIPALLSARPSYRPTPTSACTRLDVSPVIASVPVTAAAAGGSFAFDATGFTGLPNPSNTGNTISWCSAPRNLRATSSTGASATLAIGLR